MEKYVQGDVILVRVDSLPETAVKEVVEVINNGIVLQHSEVTGHFHHFKSNAAVDIYRDSAFGLTEQEKTVTPNVGKFVVIKGGKGEMLYHGKGYEEDPVLFRTGDHKALKLPDGIYRIDIVRVFDYDKKETHRVAD
jgi:hypothetical protein